MAKQLVLQSMGHGGRREGAGRNKDPHSGVSHLPRPKVKPSVPLHITVKVHASFALLRSRKGFAVFRRAVGLAKQKGLRVLQFSLLGNHFHLIVEADDNSVLSQAMRSLNICIAKGLKKLSGRSRKQVLLDRYHMELLVTPTQMKNALVYVFANVAKHFKRSRVFDYYCSYAAFPKVVFDEILDWTKPRLTAEQLAVYREVLSPPQSWLARLGWQRAVV